jgi:hypothetical protein
MILPANGKELKPRAETSSQVGYLTHPKRSSGRKLKASGHAVGLVLRLPVISESQFGRLLNTSAMVCDGRVGGMRGGEDNRWQQPRTRSLLLKMKA